MEKRVKTILKILAAVVWYIGAIVLFFKGIALLMEAGEIKSNKLAILLGIFFAFLVGIVKTKFIFIKSCKRNIKRIEELKNPKIWQFYRPSFFIFLITMISLGAYLSYISKGKFWLLVSVGTLDLALSFALLLSSIVFWNNLKSP
ncbi:MAG TPA: hypothetical protein EYP79_00415 [Campylobacterales bacterium]|nr:hypothetical protein [Campylobacterales bacterium]